MRGFSALGLAAAIGLAACGGEDVPYRGDEMLESGMTIEERITSRQDNLKSLGGAFKKTNDQLKSGSPDLDVISGAVDKIVELSEDMPTWFPEGTGPASGVDTDALPAIWEDPEGFSDAVDRFQTAAAELSQTTAGGDFDEIRMAVQQLGGACKNCHDSYRLDDD